MWKRLIFGTLLGAVLTTLVIANLFPESTNYMKGRWTKLNNVVRRCLTMDMAECFNATTNLVFTFMPTSQAQGTSIVVESSGAVKKEAVDYENENSEDTTGNATRALEMLNSLRFSEYEEANFCDLIEGLRYEDYDNMIDIIANLTNMPDDLKNRVKMSKLLRDGSVTAVDRKSFIVEKGRMVFGRVGVIRRGKHLDIVYSLHSLKYTLKENQPNKEAAEKAASGGFWSSSNAQPKVVKEGIGLELRNDLSAFFEQQAIKQFVKKCKYVLKALKDEDVVRKFTGTKEELDRSHSNTKSTQTSEEK